MSYGLFSEPSTAGESQTSTAKIGALGDQTSQKNNVLSRTMQDEWGTDSPRYAKRKVLSISQLRRYASGRDPLHTERAERGDFFRQKAIMDDVVERSLFSNSPILLSLNHHTVDL